MKCHISYNNTNNIKVAKKYHNLASQHKIELILRLQNLKYVFYTVNTDLSAWCVSLYS